MAVKNRKRAYDTLHEERIGFSKSGGGSSSSTGLDYDDDVDFIYGDQYVGINGITYENESDCFLFSWASKSKTSRKTKEVSMITLVKPTGETITKGRSLEGDTASHNLCVVSDFRATSELKKRCDPGQKISLPLRSEENTETRQTSVGRPTISMASTYWV